jgi:hypothetical protein
VGAVVATLEILDVAIENEDDDSVVVLETPIGGAMVGDPVAATGVTELRDVLVEAETVPREVYTMSELTRK